MKKLPLIIALMLLTSLVLGACKVNTATPAGQTPATQATTGTDVAEPTADTTVGTPTLAAPTVVLPTQDSRLKDDQGRMICTVYPGMFSGELSDQEKAAIKDIPAITEADWQMGAEKPVLTILEYSDFQCPACGQFYVELEKLMQARPDDVRLVFRNFPLVSLHPNATLAAQAAEAAGLQSKEQYWAMYNLLFSKQSEWSAKTTEEFTAFLKEQATGLNLDVDKFMKDLTSDEMVKKLKDQTDFAVKIGLNSTPTILLNGRPWQYQWDAYTLGLVIDLVKSEGKLHTVCPDFVIDQNKQYTATIKTEKGDIVMELYPKVAPEAVNSFVVLSREGFYDGVTFHRVLANFVAQTGDPSNTGMGGAGYEYREEVSADLKFDQEGMVGIAKSTQVGSSGSQFFITYAPLPDLNGGYTIIGKVISGMDVVKQITQRDPNTMPTTLGDKILSITIDEK
ncbi:MAG TPA: peptidylprolyl isomerase [Anaerolineaceae bacterium]|nr:peptidylprolyl isomerase [Anaerolineaceae bacterium]